MRGTSKSLETSFCLLVKKEFTTTQSLAPSFHTRGRSVIAYRERKKVIKRRKKTNIMIQHGFSRAVASLEASFDQYFLPALQLCFFLCCLLFFSFSTFSFFLSLAANISILSNPLFFPSRSTHLHPRCKCR